MIGSVTSSGSKGHRSQSTLQRFLQYLKPYRADIPIALGFVSIGAVSQSIGPFLIGWSIDHLILRGNLRGLLAMLDFARGLDHATTVSSTATRYLSQNSKFAAQFLRS
jgi:ABC-type multidrug transport system fused ATPase/permease subunit